MKKFFKKENRGITLVALVITIIILLILAAISIQAITNTGIFTQAENAKRESEIANVKEQIALDIYEKQLEPPLGSITDEQLETILGKYGTVNKEDGTIVGITTGKGYEILLKDIYGGETVEESVPDGAIVNPVNDITTWLKTGEISNQYSYTTIEQVIADSTCIQSLMNNENAMKYLSRSTEFVDAICASETTMTSLGKSAYVDDTVLNSDLWVENIVNSPYMDKVLQALIPTIYDKSDSRVYGTGYAQNNYPYYAFDKNENTSWFASIDSGINNQYIEFDFQKNVKVLAVQYTIGTITSSIHNYTIKFSHYTSDNIIIEDFSNTHTMPTETQTVTTSKKTVDFETNKIRINSNVSGYSDMFTGNIYEVQCYGRTKV